MFVYVLQENIWLKMSKDIKKKLYSEEDQNTVADGRSHFLLTSRRHLQQMKLSRTKSKCKIAILNRWPQVFRFRRMISDTTEFKRFLRINMNVLNWQVL